MKSRILHIPKLSDYQPDPELIMVAVTEEEVTEKVVHLAKEQGELVQMQKIVPDCGVICENEEGKKVLLFPSMGLPGAEQAEADAAGKRPGESFATIVAGQAMTLTVKEILLHQTCPVDDTLAKKCGIEGVTDLAGLKAAIAAELLEKKRQEQVRMLVMELQQYLCDHAVTELDEEEVNSWTMEQARLSYEENLGYGIDLRFTEDGEMLTEEETLQMLAEDMRQPFLSMLVNRKFCENLGITTDKEGIEAENELYPHVYEELAKAAEEMIG